MRYRPAQRALNLRPVNRIAVLAVAAVLLLMGCVARPATTSQEATGGARTSQPKTIRIGTRTEPVSGIALFAGSSDAAAQHIAVFHAGLTVYDAQGNLQPRIAQKVPRLEDGDWTLLPDGGM